MTENRIQSALTRLFETQRIVFWYDDNQEFTNEFDTLSLDGVEKLRVKDNEFALKHRILRESPKQNFLLYRAEKEPDLLDNWLLDVQLANAVFRTDQAAIWLSELNLPHEFADLVSKHEGFFAAGRAPKQAVLRKEKLLALILPEDSRNIIRLKMLAVCVGLKDLADVRLDVIVETLLAELIETEQPGFALIEQSGLEVFLWDKIAQVYGYDTDSPTVKDFSIELFKSCYALSVSNPKPQDRASLNQDALVLFKRWKDSRKQQIVFETLSDEYAELLDMEGDLNQRELRDVIELDYYRLIERKIIVDLVRAVEQRTLSEGEIIQACRARRQSHWYEEFAHLYTAVDVASQFLCRLDEIQLTQANAADTVQAYVRHGFKIDQLYRQFIYALKASSQMTLLRNLEESIENLYNNRFLSPLATHWQGLVDGMDHWAVSDVLPQRKFFERFVKPYTNKGKICVIISDAFRYEAAEEMASRLNRENRYHAQLNSMLSSLPSYTQLGMASLLPTNDGQSTIAQDGSVAIDGLSTQGTANRDKHLKKVLGESACAVQAKDVLEMPRETGRDLFRSHDVIYIYHNRIDHTGDKMQSEGEAFEATEKTFDDLMLLVKKLTAFNASNLLVTADHGFIYQNRPLPESDFLDDSISGDVHYRDRRFVLGENLTDKDAFKVFSAEQLGLADHTQAAIPKGIQRLRLKGSGSRFVHGGATLQEVIVPVIAINKKRQNDLATVEVDLLRGGTNVITAGQLSVTLYQAEPVTEKLQARELRAGVYSESGELISNQHKVTMDLTTENVREREMKLQFLLTQEADKANNQEVTLKLESPVAGTNQFTEYKQLKYTLRRSFTSDFDF
jgi:uncharacterized protein (TIGR02687 family)